MAEQVFLAIDLGAESGRVMAGRFDGSLIRTQEMHRFPNSPVRLAGTLRWNLLQLWSDIRIGLRKASADVGANVVSVGVDTWGVDYVLLNKNDEILGWPWHYRDSRNDGMMEAAFQRVSRKEIFRQTGLQFMQINSLYQMIAGCRANPELTAQAARFLMIPDFFHWCLSGSKVVEFTNATTSQMLNPVTRTWADGLLRSLEIPTEIFPEVVPPGTGLGTLRSEVAEFTGLGKRRVVAPATHDTGAAVAAVPCRNTGKANWAYISSGTWSLMGVEVQDAILSDEALEFNVTNEGGVDGTYRLLKNIMGLWLVQKCREAFARRGRNYDYDQLTQMATEAPPFRSLVDPNLPDFLSPDDMPDAIAAACRRTGEPVPETDGQFIRCALESLALKYRVTLDRLEQLTGMPVEVIHIVGGGCRNHLLNQLTSNACQRPVVAGPVEATALGNLMIQARSAGEVADLSEIREIIRRSEDVDEFEPIHAEQWTEALGRFRQLL